MIEITPQMILVLCPVIFLISFVDDVAGGGGIISLPAYMFIGLPSHIAAGNNKFSASMGTAFARIKYFRSGNVNLRTVIFCAFGSFLAQWLVQDLRFVYQNQG